MDSMAEKLQVAFALHATGVAMHRLTLARRNPSWSPEQVQAALDAWLHERPGAPYADGEGVPRKLDP